jgi:hypothetical protein
MTLIGRIAWLITRVQGGQTENVCGVEQRSRVAPVMTIVEPEGPQEVAEFTEKMLFYR